MKYVGTRGGDHRSFKQAILEGMPGRGGLYMPLHIPAFDPSDCGLTSDSSFAEWAAKLLLPYIDDPKAVDWFPDLCDEVFNFRVELVEIEENIWCLELFHGPTLAFKDFGARFLARIMSHFQPQLQKPIQVLVATSGDTGSAVANGFYRVPGVEVFVFYPGGQVSNFQEKQFATLGGNIHPVKVSGDFDACQALVKSLLNDRDLQAEKYITSANSINIGRLLPQMVYYHYGVSFLSEKGLRPAVSVPSGNYGNLTAGLMALQSGMKVESLIAATNANRVLPDYLESGKYVTRDSVRTIANAMDVGSPNNIERIFSMYRWDHDLLSSVVEGCAVVTDEEIRDTIRTLWKECGYLVDPHGAIGYKALKMRYRNRKPGICLGTAHPVKFHDILDEIVGEEHLKLPGRMEGFMDKKILSIPMESNIDRAKELLAGF